MGKLAGGAALIILFPIFVVAIFLGGYAQPSPADAASGSPGALKPGTIPGQYVDLITQAATLCPLTTPALLAAQIETESGFDPHASAAGIAGILPAEWKTYGRDENGDGKADAQDPADAIPTMARIDCADAAAVADVQGDRVTLMVAAYNAGARAVLQAGGVPPFPETQTYVKKVLGLASSYTQPVAVNVQGAGGACSGQWAPGVATVVTLICTKFHISAGTYANHHPDGGHAADLAYQQFGNDWTDGAPGAPGTGPQWQIATWIANNLVDTGNAWYVGHHASIHYYGDPPGVWRPINSQLGSTDPTYAHMNHIHVSWPPWYGQVGPDTFPPATNFSSPPEWTPGPLPAAAVLAAPLALRRRQRPLHQ